MWLGICSGASYSCKCEQCIAPSFFYWYRVKGFSVSKVVIICWWICYRCRVRCEISIRYRVIIVLICFYLGYFNTIPGFLCIYRKLYFFFVVRNVSKLPCVYQQTITDACNIIRLDIYFNLSIYIVPRTSKYFC